MQHSFAQGDVTAKVFGTLKNEADNQRLVGAKVIVYKDGQPSQSLYTDNLGKYLIDNLELGHIYEIKFEHPDFLGKNIRVDTQGIPETARATAFELQFDGELFKGAPDFNKDILKEPVAIAKFVDKNGKIEVGESQAERRKVEIEDEKKRTGVDKKVLKQQYDQLVIEGDAKMGASRFGEAAEKYGAALKLLPHTDPAESKYKDAKAKFDAENDAKNFEEKYAKLISDGDALFTQEKYAESKIKFTEAKKMKPKEKYPLEMLFKLEGLLAGDKNKAEYDRYITDADKKFASKFYQPAIDAYKSAAKLLPDEKYPQEKILECEGLIADALKNKDRDLKYQRLKDDADAKMNQKKYEDAIALYKEAEGLKPAETYPGTQILKATDLIKERDYLILKKKYDDIIAKGDQKFNTKDFEASIPIYEEAKSVLPKELIATEKIAAANKAIADRDEAKRRKEYETLVAQADAKFKATEYEAAVTGYEKSLGLYPNELIPKTQIAEAKRLQAEKLKKENQKAYDDLVAQADGKFNSENYEASIPIYEQAALLLPTEKYPESQIGKAKAGIGIRDAKKIRAQFDAVVKEADGKFKTDNFEGSIESYNAALAILPSEKYPQEQIDKAKAGIAKRDEKKIRDQFDALVQDADAKFKTNQFEASIETYTASLEILPLEKYPSEQISKANEAIAKRDEKKIRDQFDVLVKDADTKFKSSQFEASIETYNSALAVLPNEKYPSDQIAKAKEGITKRDEKMLRGQFDVLVADADAKFVGGNFEQSIGVYNQALAMLPSEKYPSDQIKKAMDKMGAIEAEKLKKSQFDQLVSNGDGKLQYNEFDAAIGDYKAALALYPKELYPKDQIKKAEGLIAEFKKKKEDFDKLISKADGKFNTEKWQEAIDIYNQALLILPLESYPKDQIIAATGKMDAVAAQKLMRQRFDELVADADFKFKNRDYQLASDTYQQAADLFPEELYPPKKIQECLLMMTASTEPIVNIEPTTKPIETKTYKPRVMSKYDAYIARALAKVEDKKERNRKYHRDKYSKTNIAIDDRSRVSQIRKNATPKPEDTTINILDEKTYKKGNETITEITVKQGEEYKMYRKAVKSFTTFYAEINPSTGIKFRDLTAIEWKRVTGKEIDK